MRADVFWIPENKFGNLAIMPRPRAGEWLIDELQAWKNAGVTTIVSTLTKLEVFELQLQNEENACLQLGINFISIPIFDRQVPQSAKQLVHKLQQIEEDLMRGYGVAIHCRMGVGRSSLLAGCILARQGFQPERLFPVIAKARGLEVPDTLEQKQWVLKNFTNKRD